MELIKLNKSHKESLQKLLKFSFPPEGEQDTEWANLIIKNEKIWDEAYGFLDGDNLVSTYGSYSSQLKIRGEIFDVKYIENVATLPTYRKKGLVRKGLIKELEKNCDSKFHFLGLGPFKHEFYRNLGFENAMDSKKLDLDFEFLSKKTDFKGYRTKMGKLKEAHNLRDDIAKVNKWFWEHSRYNLSKAHELFTETYIQMSKKYIAVAYNENSEPKGYIVYFEKDTMLKIEVMQFVDLQAFFSLKQFLRSYQDQVKGIHFFSIQPDFPIDLLIENYWLTGKKCSFQDNPWQMLRIVNLEKVLSKICKELPDQDIYLEVSDNLLNNNNGIFLFSKNKFERVETYSEKIDASISISDLVPLVTGRKSSFELYLTGKLSVPGNEIVSNSKNLAPQIIAEFDKIFPKVNTFSFW
ncbi:MAG: GNAT family N-acetyltransferase [Promethearchaeota archaeon]